MGKTPLELVEDHIAAAQDHLLQVTIDQLTGNLDSLPVAGASLPFLKGSVERMIVDRIEQRLVPDIEKHIETQLAFVDELLHTDDTDRVIDTFTPLLLETDPLWNAIDAPDNVERDVQADVVQHGIDTATKTADLLRPVAAQRFDHFHELAAETGHGPDAVAALVDDLLYYIPLMERYREHVDPSHYSSLLSNNALREWTLTHLLNGLRQGHEAVRQEFAAATRDQRPVRHD